MGVPRIQWTKKNVIYKEKRSKRTLITQRKLTHIKMQGERSTTPEGNSCVPLHG
jgi:hypothetical protein